MLLPLPLSRPVRWLRAVNAGLSGPTRKVPLHPTPTDAYSSAIAGLTKPTLWQTNSADPFHTDIEITSAPKLLPEKKKPDTAPVKPFNLDKITRKPCKYVFKSYIGQGENFAINDGRRTFIVDKVGGKIRTQAIPAYDTGFIVTKFEKKEVLTEKPGIVNSKYLQDVSARLTIKTSLFAKANQWCAVGEFTMSLTSLYGKC